MFGSSYQGCFNTGDYFGSQGYSGYAAQTGGYAAQTGGYPAQTGGYYGAAAANFASGQNAGFLSGQNVATFSFPTGGFSSVPPATTSYSVGDASSSSASLATETKMQGGTLSGSQDSGAVPLGSSIGPRRAARHQQQVIRLPDQPQGPPRQVRHRMPTPEPDILERVYVQRQAADIVEEITEIPTTPPPIVREKTQIEASGPPQYIKRVVRVPPRGLSAGMSQQQGGAAAAQTGAFNTSFDSSASFANVQQFHNTGAMGGFTGFSGHGAFQSQPAAPPMGISNANCFYV